MVIEIYENFLDGIREKVPSMNGHGVAAIMPTINLAQGIEAARRMIALARYPFRMVIVVDSVRNGFIKTLNAAASKINPEFAVYVAQDSLAGDRWLKIAMENIVKNQKSLLAFNDGKFNGRLAQFGLVRMSFSSKLYEEGNVFYKGYHTHRADNELTLIAKLTEQFLYSPDALMLEADYRMQRVINPDDIQLFSRRKIEILEKFKFKNGMAF